MPGIRLNVGKTGLSTYIGVRGAHVTIVSKGTRGTVGIPGTGTGISYSERLDSPQREQPQSERQRIEDTKNYLIGVLFIVALFGLAWVISKL